MFTSLTMMVVLGLGPEIGSHSLRWEHDYRQARSAAVSASKPLAVFVGAGAEGWRKVVHDCCLDADSQKTLAEKYVVVYVNQDTDAGRRIAESFQLSGKDGLVISDRSGKVQAFRHEGDITASDLSQRLTRYADPAFVATTTESSTPLIHQANYVSPFRSSCPFCH